MEGDDSAQDTLLEVGEVAERLGVKPPFVYDLIRLGELDAIDLRLPGRTKRKWRIHPAALDAYMDAHTHRS